MNTCRKVGTSPFAYELRLDGVLTCGSNGLIENARQGRLASLVAILRLRAMPSSSATAGVDAVETGELKLMADMGDSGEWVVLGMLRGTLGSRTINI
jgi:hypothetical protein